MSARHSHSPAVLRSGPILLLSLLAIVASSPAHADVGVQPVFPVGSSISPETETPIQMAAETVVMSIRPSTEADNLIVTLNPDAYGFRYFEWAPRWFTEVADVEADFTMANPTSEDVSMAVWFPLASSLEDVQWELNAWEIVPRIEGLQVRVDGKPVTYEVTEWPNPKGEDRPPLPWASFPVTFPAAREANIHVRYTVPAERGLEGVGMKLYYVFQTGAGWAGPIGKAKLIVNLPFPASAETIGSMPEGAHAEGRQLAWFWEDFEPSPQDDFSLWVLLPERWDALQQARSAVADDPQNGEAWLDLANTYHKLVLGKYQVLPSFGETYQPLGVRAAEQASRLLPHDGRPNYELAIFYLAALPEEPSREDLQPILEQLKIVEDLAPSYAPDVHDWFEFIVGTDSWSDYWAAETAAATHVQPPSATVRPGQQPSPPTGVPSRAATAGSPQGPLFVLAVIAAGTVVVAAVLLRNRRVASRK